MGRYSIDSFVDETSQEDKGEGTFELESPHLLEVNLDGKVWTKWGSMVAYRGKIKFDKAGISDKGLGKVLKEKFTGEGMMLTKATGEGTLYVADQGKKISVIDLDGDAIYVNGNDVLAFEDTIEWDVKMMKKVGGAMAGGLFNVKLEGEGMIAITTHKDPITLKVTKDSPVMTDPQATVAWSENVKPDFKTDISMKTLIGKTSGETLQMKFTGEGFVVIQPYEERTPVQPR